MRRWWVRVLVVLVAAPLGFVAAVPSSAHVGFSWIAKAGSASGASAAPRVASVSMSREKVQVRFSERVKAVHRSFGLECPLGHPKGFDLSSSPASVFTLTIKPRPLYADIRCRLVVRADWISDLGQPAKTMAKTYRFVFVPRATATTTGTTTTATTTTGTTTTTTAGTTTTVGTTTTAGTTTAPPPTTTTSADIPPTSANDSYSTAEETVLRVGAPGVLGNDSDPDSGSLTAVLVSGPAHGALTLNADGSFVYTPGADFDGVDSFSYKANDGQVDSSAATVAITVNGVNDAPVNVLPAAQSVNEDSSFVFSSGNGNGLSVADVDAGADPGFEVQLSVLHGTL